MTDLQKLKADLNREATLSREQGDRLGLMASSIPDLVEPEPPLPPPTPVEPPVRPPDGNTSVTQSDHGFTVGETITWDHFQNRYVKSSRYTHFVTAVISRDEFLMKEGTQSLPTPDPVDPPTRPPVDPPPPPPQIDQLSVSMTVGGDQYVADASKKWSRFNEVNGSRKILGLHTYRENVAAGVTRVALRFSNAAINADGSGGQECEDVEGIKISCPIGFTIVPEVVAHQESVTPTGTDYLLGAGPIPSRCAFERRFHVCAAGTLPPSMDDKFANFYDGGSGVRGEAIPNLDDPRVSSIYTEGGLSGWALARQRASDDYLDARDSIRIGNRRVGYFNMHIRDSKDGFQHGGARVEFANWNYTKEALKFESIMHGQTVARMHVFAYDAETGEVMTPEMMAAANGGKFPYQVICDDGSYKKRGTMPGVWPADPETADLLELRSWMPHDAQHAGRAILSAYRLYEALGDECARDDILAFAAYYRMSATQLPTDTADWPYKKPDGRGGWDPVDRTIYGRNNIDDALNYEGDFTGSGRDMGWICHVMRTARQVVDDGPELDAWFRGFNVWYERVTAHDGMVQHRGAPTQMNPDPHQNGAQPTSLISQAHEEAIVGCAVAGLGYTHRRAFDVYLAANLNAWPPQKWVALNSNDTHTAHTKDDIHVGSQTQLWRALADPEGSWKTEVWLREQVRPQDWNNNLNHVAGIIAEMLT